MDSQCLVWNQNHVRSHRLRQQNSANLPSVPGFAIAYLVTGHDIYSAELSDMTWYLTTPAVWHQIMLNLSIITACIPCIKRFLADLSVGLTVIAVSEPMEMTVKQTSSNNPMRGSKTGSSSEGGFFSGLMSRSRTAPSSQLGSRKGKSKPVNSSNEDPYSQRQDFQPDWATRSRPVIERSESVKGLTQNIIVQTIDYEVNYEAAPSSGRPADRDFSFKSYQERSGSTASR